MILSLGCLFHKGNTVFIQEDYALAEQSARYNIVSGIENIGLRLDNGF